MAKSKANGLSKPKTTTVDLRATSALKTDNFVTIYSNAVNVESSPWDIRIRLGQLERASQSELVVIEQAHVYMSVPHAKAFLDVLRVAIDGYEQRTAKMTVSAKAVEDDE